MRKYRITDECIYCGACEPECPERAISDDLEAGAYLIDPARCTGCPASEPPPCVAVCPVEAIVLRPVDPVPTLRMLRFRGVLRPAGGASRLLLGELRLCIPPARALSITPRAACELELEDGRALRLSLEDPRVFGPEQEARGPWLSVERSPLGEAVVENPPPTPHSYLEIAGVALYAGERAVVVGELLEQSFAPGTGGFREAPRALPSALRVRFVAADEPRSRAELEAALRTGGVTTLDG